MLLDLVITVLTLIGSLYAAGIPIYLLFVALPNEGAWSRLVIALLWPLWVYQYLQGHRD